MRVELILKATRYALIKHEDQARNASRSGKFVHYMVHPIEVAQILHAAGVQDEELLQAALLHDVLEDTETNPMTLRKKFGDRVTDIVQEVTDPPGLTNTQRKERQVERVPYMSWEAKSIKLADKISNMRDLLRLSPEWKLSSYERYLVFSQRLADAARVAKDSLVPESLFVEFDRAYSDGMAYVKARKAESEKQPTK